MCGPGIAAPRTVPARVSRIDAARYSRPSASCQSLLLEFALADRPRRIRERASSARLGRRTCKGAQSGNEWLFVRVMPRGRTLWRPDLPGCVEGCVAANRAGRIRVRLRLAHGKDAAILDWC